MVTRRGVHVYCVQCFSWDDEKVLKVAHDDSCTLENVKMVNFMLNLLYHN